MKVCSKCKETKDRSAFARNRTTKDGLQGHCRLCKGTYKKTAAAKIALNAKRRRENRRGWIHEIKLAVGCCDCGYAEHAAALDFDHVRGPKKFTIARGSQFFSKAEVLAEIEKCDVVCANCHRVRTYMRAKGESWAA